jgi:hypothetical protein
MSFSHIPKFGIFWCNRGGEKEETTLVGLTRILLGQKLRKFILLIQLVQINNEDLKQRWVNFFLKKTYVGEI